MKTLLYSLLIVLTIFVQSWAANYYVDCNAAAGGDGSLATPWDTIADVNAASFSGDDNIYFAKGCTFREQLTVPSSGASGHPIKFGAYGTGANPRINGANLITTWTEVTPTSGSEIGGIFIADAEDNGTADWTGVTTGGTATAAASTASKNNGTYGYEYTTDGTNDVFTYKTITAAGDIYIRAYVKFKTGFTWGATFKGTKILQLLSGATERGYIWVRNSGANTPVTYVRYYNISPALSSNEYAVNENTWYRLELHFKVDGSVGGWEFTVDGNTVVGDRLNLDTSGQDIDTIRTGLFITGAGSNLARPSNGTALYVDDVKADTSAVGAYSVVGVVGANVWKATLTTTPTQIIFNNYNWGNSQAAASSVDSQYDWFYCDGCTGFDDNTLFVYSTSDPDTAFTGVESPTRNNCISATSKDFLTFENLIVENSKAGNIFISTDGDGLIFNNVNSYRSMANGGYYMQADGAVTISNCESSWNYGTAGSGWKVYNSGTYTFSGCRADYNGEDGFNTNGSGTLNITRSTANYNGWSLSSGAGDGYTAHSTSVCNISYSIASNNYKSGIAVMNTGGGTIYNNTLYNNYEATVTGNYGIWFGAPGTWIVKNNITANHEHEIIVNAAAYGDGSGDGTNGIALTSDYNNFYPSRGATAFFWNTTNYTFADWKTQTSGDSHSFITDPLFVSTSDFRLLGNSPARNAGTNVSLTTDFYGRRVKTIPDIGAIEYFGGSFGPVEGSNWFWNQLFN